uniref:Uncharacterized protein n=1 Tax=Aegilops tauschii subsp. strangulata TaxID=200361 RepID=A0A452ZQ54_AEGTS
MKTMHCIGINCWIFCLEERKLLLYPLWNIVCIYLAPCCYGNLICACTLNFQEYVKGISSSGMQSNCGFEGQINACWTHKVTTKELDTIRAAGFLVSVIHGRLVS